MRFISASYFTQTVMAKKQIPLRISEELYDKLAVWAADEFRSVNGQIEYLLTDAVRRRGKNADEASGEKVESEENENEK